MRTLAYIFFPIDSKLIPWFNPQSCGWFFPCLNELEGSMHATVRSIGTRIALKHIFNILTRHSMHPFNISVLTSLEPVAFLLSGFYTSSLVMLWSVFSKTKSDCNMRSLLLTHFEQTFKILFPPLAHYMHIVMHKIDIYIFPFVHLLSGNKLCSRIL